MNKVKNLFSCGGDIGDVLDVSLGAGRGVDPQSFMHGSTNISAKRSLANDCVVKIMSPRAPAGACL